MSTRAYIARKIDDGFEYIYCHNSGEEDIAVLIDDYGTDEKVKELISLGDISSLGSKVIPNPGRRHTFEHPQKDVTVAYYRDRNEGWLRVKPGRVPALHELLGIAERGGIDFVFTFDNGVWASYEIV